jgi:2-polyprenyl-3-methyl-5-hydroxy-6-metoxy-1,4-benzoquinol methylase
MIKCRICFHPEHSIVYEGQIRSGGVGSGFVKGYTVIECDKCGFVQLSPVPEKLDEFYETEEYRSQFDYKFDPSSIHSKYDHEQNERIARIGIQNIRGKIVLDLGSSAGVFLDTVHSLAHKTIAVEPAGFYKEYLTNKGHTYYPYPEDAIAAGELVDIITCFDVIEHVPDPLDLVKSAFKLLKPGGIFILSMPNLNDLLRKVTKDKFEPFFFMIAHLNYFGKDIIPYLFMEAGFKTDDLKVDFIHKYGLENLIRWAKYGSPGPICEVDNLLDRFANQHFKSDIERLGISSHLFISAKKKI